MKNNGATRTNLKRNLLIKLDGTRSVTFLEADLYKMSEGSSTSLVPSWNGVVSEFPAYQEKALDYIYSTDLHKQYLCGPRLLAKLSGHPKTEALRRGRDYFTGSRGGLRLSKFLHHAFFAHVLIFCVGNFNKKRPKTAQ